MPESGHHYLEDFVTGDRIENLNYGRDWGERDGKTENSTWQINWGF